MKRKRVLVVFLSLLVLALVGGTWSVVMAQGTTPLVPPAAPEEPALIIPVTGANPSALPAGCSVLSQSDGSEVELCGMPDGYQGIFQGVGEGALPAPLPDGAKLLKGLSLDLLDGNGNSSPLPPGADASYLIKLPEGTVGTVVAYIWDPLANGGAGGWVELPGVVVENGVATVSGAAGTVVFAIK